jgi:hypothetical protein
MGGLGAFNDTLSDVRNADYKGFKFTAMNVPQQRVPHTLA